MKLVILVLSTLLLHFVYGAAPVGSVTPCSELVIRSGGCNDLACSPSKYFSTSTSETVQIPANGNQGPFVNPNPDASKVLTYRISGVGGTWDQYKQTTTLGLFVDGTAGQTVAAQVTYDFTGDGVIDRTEVFKPFTLDGNQGFQEWLVSGDANGLQQVPASAWVINMNNGIVELKIWAYAATAVPMTLYINKLSSVSIPYNGYWVAPASLSDACKVPATAGTSSNSVAFFIDAVQDFYLGDTIRAMIGVFTAANASLTLGIPANKIGTDASIMTTLTEVLRKKDWEIACNGFDYEDFSTLNFQQQTTALDNCKNSIQGKLFYDVQTFIPPNFAAAKDTLTALRSSNFSYYIPPRNTENGPFAMQAASFYKYPVQARTTGAVSATFLLGQIRTSVNTDGYAVVGLHPQAFSSNNVLNPAAITELTNLIQQVKTNGWSIVPVRALPLDVDASENHRLFVPNCSCIAFRLDDIQNFAVKEHQKAIMDLFREFDASITVGIIGSMFSLADPDIVGYIQDKMTQQTDCFRFEIANHGYLHEDFTTIDANEQNTRIQLTQGIIRDTLGVTPKSFIPPFNIFNRGTIDALVQNNIKYMSSATGNDPSPLNNTEVYRVPCGAFTSNLTVTQYFTPVTYQSTWLDIQKQLELQGFAAVMMHPYEFGGWDATNGYSASVNPNTLAGLRSLLQLCKNAGLRFVTIEEVETYFNPYHVYPCTGQALINGTAPNQTVVTTGSSQSSQSTQSTQSTQTRSNTQSTQSTQSTQTTRSSTQSNTQSQSSSQSQSSTQSNTQSNSQSSTRSETQSTSTTTTEGNDILSAASSVAVTAFTIILFGLLF